jgi:hypothetical protein
MAQEYGNRCQENITHEIRVTTADEYNKKRMD